MIQPWTVPFALSAVHPIAIVWLLENFEKVC